MIANEKLTVKTGSEVLNRFYFYQIGDGQLLGSENPFVYPESKELVDTIVERFRVRVLVSLMPVFTEYRHADVTHYQCPLSNHCVPSIDEVRPIVSVLSDHIRRGEVIWCHCQRGLDRTGCILGGLLVRLGLSAGDAIQEITSCFPNSRQLPKMRDLWKPYERLIGLIANDV